MTRRFVTVASAVVLALVATVFVAFASSAGTSSTHQPTTVAGTSAAGSTASAPVAPAKRRNGSEQPSEAAGGGTDLSKGLPGMKPATRLSVGKPPGTAVAHGRLVTGFPDQVLTLPSSTTLGISAVAVEGRRVRVDLTGVTQLSVQAVLDHYRRTLGAHGMLGAPVPAVAGTTAEAFGDGTSSATVTVGDHTAQGRTVTVAAVLQAAATTPGG